jgi:hypothetical protein
MHTKEIGRNLYQVELNTGGIQNLICSYVIKGAKPLLVESGPSSSVPNLLSGLKELDVKLEDVEYVTEIPAKRQSHSSPARHATPC